MRRVAVMTAMSLAVACLGGILAESCGAMTFELPPEEPQPEAAPPPRLLRHDAGSPGAARTNEPAT
jgi:hypothetical protein